MSARLCCFDCAFDYYVLGLPIRFCLFIYLFALLCFYFLFLLGKSALSSGYFVSCLVLSLSIHLSHG